jgi:prolipoprotein diacylglyceryltransferase
MRQYLFQIPFTDRIIPPDGWWLPGYGVMLLCAFLIVIWWGGRRSVKVGLPSPKLQDLAMALFISGIVGARVLYMIQYWHEFPDHSIPGLAVSFISIWQGGLVVYGAVFGGFLGYLVFRRVVLKKLGINGWQLADVAAPLLAIGMAVGRIGCFLNGCCWGQVAVEECQPVILPAFGEFPLLPAHCRTQVCLVPKPNDRLPQIHGLQTSTGYSVGHDPRVIDAVEPGSEAQAAGLKPGDRIVEVNGQPNAIDESGRDLLSKTVNNWPKGATGLTLVVERGGAQQTIAYTPRTVTFFPTQIYETISMLLLTLLLVCFQPFRRHDGQVMVLLMVGYGVHRFLNEAIRIEPTYAMGLTLSQWILRKTQPKLPPGAVPLGYTMVENKSAHG